MSVRTRRSILLVVSLISSLLAVISPIAPAQADTNPSTENLVASCAVVPSSSAGTIAGLTAVAPGEAIKVRSSLTLDAGLVYQDVLTRPDGSTYFASVIELLPPAAAGVTIDPTSAHLTIGGVPTALVAGTQPVPDTWVLDTTGGQVRVYFPGDADQMLADVAGVGLPSYTVPSDGTVFAVEVDGRVGSDAAITAGSALDARDVPGLHEHRRVGTVDRRQAGEGRCRRTVADGRQVGRSGHDRRRFDGDVHDHRDQRRVHAGDPDGPGV